MVQLASATDSVIHFIFRIGQADDQMKEHLIEELRKLFACGNPHERLRLRTEQLSVVNSFLPGLATCGIVWEEVK